MNKFRPTFPKWSGNILRWNTSCGGGCCSKFNVLLGHSERFGWRKRQPERVLSFSRVFFFFLPWRHDSCSKCLLLLNTASCQGRKKITHHSNQAIKSKHTRTHIDESVCDSCSCFYSAQKRNENMKTEAINSRIIRCFLPQFSFWQFPGHRSGYTLILLHFDR